jgi:hypothetical protein
LQNFTVSITLDRFDFAVRRVYSLRCGQVEMWTLGQVSAGSVYSSPTRFNKTVSHPSRYITDVFGTNRLAVFTG